MHTHLMIFSKLLDKFFVNIVLIENTQISKRMCINNHPFGWLLESNAYCNMYIIYKQRKFFILFACPPISISFFEDLFVEC